MAGSTGQQKHLPLLHWIKSGKNSGCHTKDFYPPGDYPVYRNINEVPLHYIKDNFYIIEKFLPETQGNVYYTNQYVFFGNSYHCFKFGSLNPVVNTATNTSVELIEPHPEIVKQRRKLNFDYGKFDYCIHKGAPVLLDTNKIIGMGRLKFTPQINAMIKARGEGLYSFFE